MLNLCLPMKVINISQHSGGSFSHPNYCLDLTGGDQGVDFAYALGNYWKCIAGPWGSNTYFFTACDQYGSAVQVHCADGQNRIITVAMTHSNMNYTYPVVGHIFSNGEAMYEEGTAGYATGNHIHYEVAEGLQYGKTLDKNLNVYRMTNELKPEDVCFICDSFSKVANLDGVNMKHCDTPYYEQSNSLNQYTDLELAQMVMRGEFGNGTQRREALGDRYVAVQTLVNQIMAKNTQDGSIPGTVPAPESAAINYRGLDIYIVKMSKKLDLKGSIDGNKYGTMYDKTTSAGFSDHALEQSGYTEIIAQNGSTFYSWNGMTYAEGIEISKGSMNQELYLSAVTTFNPVMAIGFPKSGGIVFARQQDILADITKYYGAITGIFGIMYHGEKNFMGSEINRNNCFALQSGRSIIAEDDKYYYSICFNGVTGTSGLTGTELYDLCKTVSSTMINAICFDGGGSVFQRFKGEYNINTTRAVKNAVLLFAKMPVTEEFIVEEPVEEVNPLTEYSDEKLAEMVLEGAFSSGEARKDILGDRYVAVQTIVNIITLRKVLKFGMIIRVRKAANTEYDPNIKYYVTAIDGDYVSFVDKFQKIYGRTHMKNISVIY